MEKKEGYSKEGYGEIKMEEECIGKEVTGNKVIL
jgi:hypothetical protein